MKQAVYSAGCGPHFGLALKTYTHFTSPIRRYPDLMVHRILKDSLPVKAHFVRAEKEVPIPHGAHSNTTASSSTTPSSLEATAVHSSEMERVAEKASRESQIFKAIQFMQKDVGKTFMATITSAANAGVYVRLDNSLGGFIPLRKLGDEYFIFDRRYQTLTGDITGKVYRLGDSLRVKLVGAFPRERKLSFVVAKKS
jgi:ribonuclease R